MQRVYCVGGDFYDKQPAAVDAFMVAMVRAHDWLHEPANYEKLRQHLKQDGYQLEDDFFIGTVKEQVTLVPRNALPTQAGAQAVLDEIKNDIPGVSPDTLLRLGPVQKAIQQTGARPS